MLLKRLIVCLDVRDGRVTKGVRFQGNVDVGDPVEMAARYCADGADEIVFYDITASAERRQCDLGMVARAARALSVPFTVGGGIRGVEDMRAALLAGADKVSLNSLAVLNPVALGAGEICLNAIDTDGVRQGYELTVTRLVSDAVPVPVIASGGAGEPRHLAEAFREGHADAALVASMVHTMGHTCQSIKAELRQAGLPIR